MQDEKPLSRERVEERFGTVGGFRLPSWRQRGGLVWLLLLVIILALVLSGGLSTGGKGVNLREALAPFPTAPGADGPVPQGARAVALDVQETWRRLFEQAGVDFRPAQVALGADAASECASTLRSQSGAAYCDFDAKLLLDPRLGPADVAHAYAHHVQNLLGITDQIRRAEEERRQQAPGLWAQHELQADCLAGIWAHAAFDDRPGGPATTETPDIRADSATWAAPSTAESARWFQRGYESGRPSDCNTFAAGSG